MSYMACNVFYSYTVILRLIIACISPKRNNALCEMFENDWRGLRQISSRQTLNEFAILQQRVWFFNVNASSMSYFDRY